MAFAVLLVTSNTPAAYAALLDVPVLGEAVKIFHIGSGGLISDGLQMGLAAVEERLRLVFGKSTDEYAAAVPAYKIEQFVAPDQIVITVHGIRSFDPATFIHEAEKCDFIKTAYREKRNGTSGLSAAVKWKCRRNSPSCQSCFQKAKV